MKASLLRRMILAQGLVVILLWMGLVGFLLAFAYGWIDKNALDLPMKIQASTLLAVLQDERDPVRIQHQAQRLQSLAETYPHFNEAKRDGYRSIFQICDAEGRMLFRSDAAPKGLLCQGRSGFRDLTLDGKPWRVLVMEEPQGRLRVLVAESLATRQRQIWRGIFLQTPVQFSILFLGLAACTWLVSRQALKPLRSLAEAVDARSPGDLSPLEGHADLLETRPLIRALNGLFHRVQELLNTQARFVADAAHELRTPLAVIGAQAHVLQHAKDDAQREIAALELQRGVERGAQAIRQLLAIARLEATGEGLVKAPLDLARLARERVASLVPQTLAKAQDLGYEGPETLSWVGEPSALASAMDNLLMNAHLHTPKGSRITLSLQETEAEIVLAVEDTGPGVPPSFLPCAWDRFTRVPGTQEPGSGLGLAIVRTAIELHGGTVELLPRVDGTGLRVVLHLPRMGTRGHAVSGPL